MNGSMACRRTRPCEKAHPHDPHDFRCINEDREELSPAAICIMRRSTLVSCAVRDALSD